MKILTKEQVLKLHAQLTDIFGGSSEIRDEALLDSAINTPFQTFDGEDLYPTLLDKASRLCFELVNNIRLSMEINASELMQCLCFLQ